MRKLRRDYTHALVFANRGVFFYHPALAAYASGALGTGLPQAACVFSTTQPSPRMLCHGTMLLGDCNIQHSPVWAIANVGFASNVHRDVNSVVNDRRAGVRLFNMCVCIIVCDDSISRIRFDVDLCDCRYQHTIRQYVDLVLPWRQRFWGGSCGWVWVCLPRSKSANSCWH